MITNSLNAIRKLLNDTFPEVARIYLNTTPDSFTRPSFFVQLITDTDQYLTGKVYGSRISWQIVYFAPLDNTDNPNTMNQFNVFSRLKKVLMEGKYVASPDDGSVFHVVDVTGGPRDTEVYLTVRLDVENSIEDPVHENVEDVSLTIKEGD